MMLGAAKEQSTWIWMAVLAWMIVPALSISGCDRQGEVEPCDAGESCTDCPGDCGTCPSCGDGSCDAGESCQSCPADCGPCDTCDPPCVEGQTVCCPAPLPCAGRCVPDCRVPGNPCPPQIPACNPDTGLCEGGTGPGCGDGTCFVPQETCQTCSQDCGECRESCGDGSCESPRESCQNCPRDCGLCPTSGNRLCNPSFEEGNGNPGCWNPEPAGGEAVFTWEEGMSTSGSRSVSIQGGGSGSAAWTQVVDVTAGAVYLFTAFVGFEGITPPGCCNLQVVFLDNGGLALQTVDYPAHDGNRELALDFPPGLKIRAPEGASRAEINLHLEGSGQALFDDVFFGPAPGGAIGGTVKSGGAPLEGARVFLWGDPWGKPHQALTAADGSYRLDEVPVAFPRYILLAQKAGYQTRAAGRIEILDQGTTTVDFDLPPGSDPRDDLRVKSATLELARAQTLPRFPVGAVIPTDRSGYPEAVRVFLDPNPIIESDHPVVVALAGQLLASVEHKSSTREVAWAVYEWVSRNIDHDGVFSVKGGGLDVPFKDVTSGIWQTISWSGWSFGKSFYDWEYRPGEMLGVKSGICVEHALLGSALLRALNIPARPFSGSLEFWAQTAPDAGAWFGLSTTSGRTDFREHGRLGSGFAGGGLSTYPVTAGPMVHEDWNGENRGLWRETHPWGVGYPATPEGLASALADLDRFSRTGEAPPGNPPEPGQDAYQIHYRDVTLNLYNLGAQRVLDVRFPLVPPSTAHQPQDREAYWTNHPECVTRTWIEETENPPVDGVERWFHIELDLGPLLQ